MRPRHFIVAPKPFLLSYPALQPDPDCKQNTLSINLHVDCTQGEWGLTLLSKLLDSNKIKIRKLSNIKLPKSSNLSDSIDKLLHQEIQHLQQYQDPDSTLRFSQFLLQIEQGQLLNHELSFKNKSFSEGNDMIKQYLACLASELSQDKQARFCCLL